MNTKQLREAIHNSVPLSGANGTVYYERPNVCNRTFAVDICNPDDIKICTNYIGSRCYRKFFGGQMEHVLDNCVEISYVITPYDLAEVVRELRKLGVNHTIDVYVEYVESYLVPFTTLKGV